MRRGGDLHNLKQQSITGGFNMTFESLGDGPHENNNVGSVNFNVKAGLAQMLKGGVIMDVVNAEQVFAVFPMEPASLPQD